jgi:hypothetical protein
MDSISLPLETKHSDLYIKRGSVNDNNKFSASLLTRVRLAPQMTVTDRLVMSMRHSSQMGMQRQHAKLWSLLSHAHLRRSWTDEPLGAGRLDGLGHDHVHDQ